MFKLIASDLREFVSAVKLETVSAVNIVKQDAIGALDRLDESLGLPVPSEAEREAKFRASIREVYSTALPAEENTKGETNPTAYDHEPFQAFELKEVSSFLSTFNILEKTDEICELLQANEKLRQIFEELVPIEVTYEEFWRRHFYRCDAGRIQRAWDTYEALGRNEANTLSKIGGVIAAPVRLALQPFSAARKTTGDSLEPSWKSKETKSPDQVLKDTQSDMNMMQSALAMSNNRIGALRLSVDELKNDLKEARGANVKLNIDVVLLKKQLQQKDEAIKILEDEVHSKLGVSQTESFATNKTTRYLLDASGRTETSDSSSSESTADQHIGTCVTLPVVVPRDKSDKRSSSIWKLAAFGTWGGDASESENSTGASSADEVDIAGPLIHYLEDN